MSSTVVEVLRSAARGLAVVACAACIPRAVVPPLEEDASVPAIDASNLPPIDAFYDPGMITVVGDISPVHDPVIMASNTKFYVYSTGKGLEIRESSDLRNWRRAGSVFETKPSWITTTNPNDPNGLWAPDVSYFGGQYHLYYSASSFGSNDSCIGHATSPSLDEPVWEDKGAVICSTSSDNWNAIDPAAIVDQTGGIWLALGSFWSGLQLIQLDSNGGRSGTYQEPLATRSNTAVEAAYIIHHGDFYYLFESVDRCCQGANSNYKIMVGRATDIAGPYVDQVGNELAAGGGTLVLAGGARWKGPGHNAILHTATGDYNAYHSYDATAGGVPTLRIAELHWTADAWPTSAGP